MILYFKENTTMKITHKDRYYYKRNVLIYPVLLPIYTHIISEKTYKVVKKYKFYENFRRK